MIDVPIAVRDALKDGGYKKNYRFIVGSVGEEPVYDTEASLTLNTQYTTRNGNYRLYNDNHATGITYTLNGTSVTVAELTEDLAGGYYCDLGDLVIGSTITITAATYSIDLRRKTNQTQEVFQPEITIENNKLVKESIKIDERMCSDDNLKFGLCEGSNLEFQAFNVGNLTGKRVQAFVDVEYPVISYDYDVATNITTKYEEIEKHSIPMGWYDISETSRQASTGIRKVSAYNKLKSDYLDTQVNALIIEEFGTATVRIIDILTFLLRRYGIKTVGTDQINYTPTGDEQRTEPKKFQPFKYSEMYWDGADAFNTRPFWNEGRVPSWGSNFYMEGDARVAMYQFYNIDPSTPVQIKVDECINQLDANIANYIQTELAKLEQHCNTSAATLWDRLQHMYSTYYYWNITGWFFYVEIKFNDGTVRRYGNTYPNATGTFDQLSRTTFTNVFVIRIVTPLGIRYGYRFDPNNSRHLKEEVCVDTSPTPPYMGGVKNFVMLYGDYAEVNDMRTPPRMPDGTAIPKEINNFFKVQILTSGYTPAELIEVDPTKMASVTLRDLQTAVFETQCRFGRLDRENNYFTGIELNNGRLYPADNLYPDDDLYPLSTSESGFRAMYSKLWADEGNVRSWRSLIITYKGFIEDPDTHEKSDAEKIYQVTVDANGTDDYEVKDNWLFKNLPWADAESASWAEAAGLERIEDYAAAMVAKMTSVSWFPFEMWCAGLPYVETGDEVEINIGDGAYTSYVLRRTIKGIQNLQDEMINGTLDIF